MLLWMAIRRNVKKLFRLSHNFMTDTLICSVFWRRMRNGLNGKTNI